MAAKHKEILQKQVPRHLFLCYNKPYCRYGRAAAFLYRKGEKRMAQMNQTPAEEMTQQEYSELVAVRRQKLADLQQAGKEKKI